MATHILVIGATGQSGLDFCTAALKDGYKLTLYLRNPSKLPAEISGNKDVTVVKGTLEDEAAVKQVIASGATIFISFAGPVGSSKGTPVTDFHRFALPLLVEHKYQRALILCTPSYHAPKDKGGLKWRLSVMLIKIIGGSAYQEFSGLGALVASQDTAALKWTIFRVGFLGNGEVKPVKATFTGSGEDGIGISRKSIAAWVLAEIKEEKWVGEAPLLCN
ncbi:MAG: hypothetical protein M1818_007088 [Claussenomyces sp. TS43310]|nr:MAG: hypothetical protein M1818_007088 [Claussenomyces sp. TS43310]